MYAQSSYPGICPLPPGLTWVQSLCTGKHEFRVDQGLSGHRLALIISSALSDLHHHQLSSSSSSLKSLYKV